MGTWDVRALNEIEELGNLDNEMCREWMYIGMVKYDDLRGRTCGQESLNNCKGGGETTMSTNHNE